MRHPDAGSETAPGTLDTAADDARLDLADCFHFKSNKKKIVHDARDGCAKQSKPSLADTSRGGGGVGAALKKMTRLL